VPLVTNRGPNPSHTDKAPAGMRACFLPLIISCGKFVIHLAMMGKTSLMGERKRMRRMLAQVSQTFCVHPPDAKHVIVLIRGSSLRKDVGVGVKTFEDQLDVAALEQLSRDIESSLIFPDGLAYPLQLLLVVAIEGIVDQLVVSRSVCTQPGTFAGYHLSLPASRNCQPASRGILIFDGSVGLDLV